MILALLKELLGSGNTTSYKHLAPDGAKENWRVSSPLNSANYFAAWSGPISTGAPESFQAFQPPAIDQTLL